MRGSQKIFLLEIFFEYDIGDLSPCFFEYLKDLLVFFWCQVSVMGYDQACKVAYFPV